MDKPTRVRITKVEERPDAKVPGNKPVGTERVGTPVALAIPTVGYAYEIRKDDGTYYCTSTVLKIIDSHTFKTHNSVYKFERLD